MLDPLLAKTVAQSIATAFCAVDHERCPQYTAGLDRFRAAVDAKMAAWQATLAPFKGAKVVTYHKDFDYFFARFDIEVLDTLEPKPGIPPSPTHLTELVPKMRASNVSLIVVEPYRERSNPDFVAEKTGVRVLALPAIPPDNPPDYVSFIDSEVQAVAGGLRGGRATP
jgi:ABC-type Zn uptake system ZnuABC Zn-binding protein ZnuA